MPLPEDQSGKGRVTRQLVKLAIRVRRQYSTTAALCQKIMKMEEWKIAEQGNETTKWTAATVMKTVRLKQG